MKFYMTYCVYKIKINWNNNIKLISKIQNIEFST